MHSACLSQHGRVSMPGLLITSMTYYTVTPGVDCSMFSFQPSSYTLRQGMWRAGMFKCSTHSRQQRDAHAMLWLF